MFRFIPLVDSLSHYNKSWFRGDLSAGLTVGVMLIPQGMAYAMIAGVPPVYGLYTALIPTMIYAIFGTCRQLAVGPVAMDSLLVATGVSTLAIEGSEHYLLLVILLTAMVGGIQLLMGGLRLGFLVSFLSRPVIYGFTFAAAVIIGISQLKYLLGVNIGRVESTHQQLMLLIQSIGEVHILTLLLAVMSIGIIVVCKRIFPNVPGNLAVVGLGMLGSMLWSWEQSGVMVIGDIPEGLPGFKIPDTSWSSVQSLLVIALTLAMVGFMEAYSLGKNLQGKHQKEYEIEANRELISLGLGNVLGSFFGSMPATGGFSRSAVNEAAGAKTGVASLISALVVVATLLFLTPLFYYLPLAVLGAVILVAVVGLIDLGQVRSIWQSDRYDFFMLLATFLSTLAMGIVWGILIGIVLSLLVLIYKTANPHMAVLGRVPGTQLFRNFDRFDNAIDDPSIVILRFDARLFFANSDALKNKIRGLVHAKPQLKKFILDGQSISDVDSTGIETLEQIHQTLEHQGIEFHITCLIGPVRDKLYRSDFISHLGMSGIHNSIVEVLDGDGDAASLSFQTNEETAG